MMDRTGHCRLVSAVVLAYRRHFLSLAVLDWAGPCSGGWVPGDGHRVVLYLIDLIGAAGFFPAMISSSTPPNPLPSQEQTVTIGGPVRKILISLVGLLKTYSYFTHL